MGKIFRIIFAVGIYGAVTALFAAPAALAWASISGFFLNFIITIALLALCLFTILRISKAIKLTGGPLEFTAKNNVFEARFEPGRAGKKPKVRF